MKKILIINTTLMIGGGEKLINELASFALKNDIEPTVLIPDSTGQEYYDSILKEKGVKIVRKNISTIARMRNPVNMMRSLFWKLKLKYFLNGYNTVHIINLHNAVKFYNSIKHRRRYFWHIANAIQYNNRLYDYNPLIFSHPSDTIVYINKEGKDEIQQQYGIINSKEIVFKLFLNEPH